MVVPFPMMIPAVNPTHEQRIRQLEHALLLSLDAIHALTECLEAKFGPGALRPDWGAFREAVQPTELDQELTDIDRLIADGLRPKAVKHFHEHLGATWDEAQLAVSMWSRNSPAEKRRALRLARFVKLMEAKQ